MDGKMAFKSRMLFSKLYEIIVNKVTFVGFVGAIAPIARLDPPLSVMMRLKFFSRKTQKIWVLSIKRNPLASTNKTL